MSKKNKENDWKDRLGVVFSTSDDYNFDYDSENEEATLPPNAQCLYVRLEKKGRGGKQVTIIEEFVGTEEDLKTLGKLLKTKCGVGGTSKDGEIVLQGDFRKKIGEILRKEGYKVKGV